ncbi:tachylectin-related carbohydrate-binding protein [Kibdelosporangium aridum]|uniref:Tachylectin n=1 Tax=Kibdelosporangium aridum TaxID=2030 RepID=A0A1W2FNG7_KIBAR|nr:tachylectin-related carbohydrate-binding protein [Kibdelosporangium aridum]SMD23475.1 Tachylectin [Kibdelosporangium aridum]
MTGLIYSSPYPEPREAASERPRPGASTTEEFPVRAHFLSHARRLWATLLAFVFAVSGIVVATSVPAYADASCSGSVSVYGVLPDGRLTYTMIDPNNGNIQRVLVSSQALGFTAKAMATLNFNTILVTSTGGVLHRVDIITNGNALTFGKPVVINGGWTHNLLTYDGHGHLYGTTSSGTLLQYLVSQPKPSEPHIGQRREIGNGGFTLKTLAAAGDDRLIATAGGQLISYAIDANGGYKRSQLDDAGWSSFENFVSPGGGLYYGKNPDGAMYWYEDRNPADGSGADITYHLSDPVASRGWTQYLLSADPTTCKAVTPTNTLRSRIGTVATNEIGQAEHSCDKYHEKCDRGDLHWCAMFATWVWQTAGVQGVPRSTFMARGLGEWGVDRGLFKYRSGAGKGSPKIGDWVIYGPPDGGGGGHVDVVTAVRPDGTLTVVGGNVNDKVTRKTIDPDTYRSGAGNYLISGYVSPPGA